MDGCVKKIINIDLFVHMYISKITKTHTQSRNRFNQSTLARETVQLIPHIKPHQVPLTYNPKFHNLFNPDTPSLTTTPTSPLYFLCVRGFSIDVPHHNFTNPNPHYYRLRCVLPDVLPKRNYVQFTPPHPKTNILLFIARPIPTKYPCLIYPHLTVLEINPQWGQWGMKVVSNVYASAYPCPHCILLVCVGATKQQGMQRFKGGTRSLRGFGA